MRTSFALTLAAILATSSVGCANRPLRNILHRGAPCGPAAATTIPMVGDVTTYSPAFCGEADCAACGIPGGSPIIYGQGYPLGVDGIPVPQPME